MFKMIWLVLRAVPFLLWNYFTWILHYYHKRKKYTIEVRYAKVRKFIIKALKVLHVELEVEGVENLNSPGIKMLTPNHQAVLDPAYIIALSEKPVAFMAKIESKKIPLINKIMGILDCDYLDRKDLHQQVRVLKNVENSLLEGKMNWGVFPEGTRNKDIDNVVVNEFHPGTFKMAIRNNFDVVPVAIDNSYKVLSKKYHAKRFKIKISFLPPVNAQSLNTQNTIDFAKDVQKQVEDKIIEFRK